MMGKNTKLIAMLHWRSNDEWFVFDPTAEFGYRLTPAATKEARDSFEAWKEHRRITE